MSTDLQSVTVRVPGTTANLGPGFDVLGLALNVWMEVTVTESDKFGMELEGNGAAEVTRDNTNFVVMSCELAFKHAGVELPALHYHVKNAIPFGCGVGSSSAAATAGYLAGTALCGKKLPTQSSEALLDVMVELEGHPDNAAAAIYGGMQIGYKDTEGHFRTARVPTPSTLMCVLFSPTIKMKQNTHATRGLVPSQVPMADAVHNMSRTSLITLAMATNQLHLLKNCLDEKFHQPQRYAALFPHAQPTVDAAMANGACYAFLSGAGPSIMAFVACAAGDYATQEESERIASRVADAMVEAAAKAGIPGKVIITTPSTKGGHVAGRYTLNENVSVLQ